jgi:hypothetical protein
MVIFLPLGCMIATVVPLQDVHTHDNHQPVETGSTKQSSKMQLQLRNMKRRLPLRILVSSPISTPGSAPLRHLSNHIAATTTLTAITHADKARNPLALGRSQPEL